jgi:hypothetical protein
MNNQPNIYCRINKILELAHLISNGLNEIDKNYIINKINELNWTSIENYYNKLSRKNLVSHYFILWKIVINSNNIKLINKFNFDSIIVKKINNGLQNMLWDILFPDEIELS